MVQQTLEHRPALALRDYQQECVEALLSFRRGGGSRALVAMPTGTGKSLVFSQVPKYASKKVLVLSHREELQDQNAAQIQRANPTLRVEVEQADRHASAEAQVVVASVQTFAASPKRLARWDPAEFSTIICDEAHHAVAISYLQIFRHFGLVPEVADLRDGGPEGSDLKAAEKVRFQEFLPAPGTPFLVGFTATPSRTDKRGLEYIFDEIAYSRTIREMMEAGWLCKVRGVRIETGADISGVKMQAGDFQEKALAEEVNTLERNGQTVKAYQEHAPGRHALVFCVNVEHAYDMQQVFVEEGLTAAVVVGSTPSEERHAIIRDYRDGKVMVLIGVMVFTEGFDAPETDCVIMARPTRSSLVYTQAIGRGTRIAEGKEDLIVIDMVDLASKGVMVQSVNTLFGLPPKLKISEDTDVLTAQMIVEEAAAGLPLRLFDEAKSLEDLQQKAREFDPLAATAVEDWVARLSPNAWVKTSFGYTISAFDYGQLGIVTNMLGGGELRRRVKGEGPTTLGFFHTVYEAIQAGDVWLGEVMGSGVLKRDARWRGMPASKAQLTALKRMKVEYPPNITKGGASALIDSHKAKRTGRMRY